MEFTKREREAIIRYLFELIGYQIAENEERARKQALCSDNFSKNLFGLHAADIKKDMDSLRTEHPDYVIMTMSSDKKELVLKMLNDIAYIDNDVNNAQVRCFNITKSFLKKSI